MWKFYIVGSHWFQKLILFSQIWHTTVNVQGTERLPTWALPISCPGHSHALTVTLLSTQDRGVLIVPGGITDSPPLLLYRNLHSTIVTATIYVVFDGWKKVCFSLGKLLICWFSCLSLKDSIITHISLNVQLQVDQQSVALTIYFLEINIEQFIKYRNISVQTTWNEFPPKKLLPDSPVSLKHRTEAMWEAEQLPRFSLVLLGHSRREASSPVQLNPLSQYGPRRLLMVASSSW